MYLGLTVSVHHFVAVVNAVLVTRFKYDLINGLIIIWFKWFKYGLINGLIIIIWFNNNNMV